MKSTKPHRLSVGVLRNNITAGQFAVSILFQSKWSERKSKAVAIQQEDETFKTLIHLGFRTTVSNYSHGNRVKAVVFQGSRKTTFSCNYALLYMNQIPYVVWQPLKPNECPFPARSHELVYLHCTRKVNIFPVISMGYVKTAGSVCSREGKPESLAAVWPVIDTNLLGCLPHVWKAV